VPNLFRRGFDSLVLLVSWKLWKERNRRTFDGITKTPAEVLVSIREEGELVDRGRIQEPGAAVRACRLMVQGFLCRTIVLF
jgi:hypothetical protein